MTNFSTKKCRLYAGCEIFLRLIYVNKLSKTREVAINVGYQDPLYFSRLYKKYFGIPPSKMWRK
ncbi:hypothetical protein HMPREF1866_02288 [Lachnoanaerobaculum saburreum]|uniref:HTH araC/xylS-type domain-containing protein n=1 Tax=Lachnoanaerobaculum saburreum TaxID=467210 RepID=A0A133ZHJ6_9FIRM|nr:hypothetical protein HMPREF1866_02288 [Lachnoanaerobaculum saburreum]